MSNNELKTIWHLAILAYIVAFFIWALNTIFFLFYEGWHLKATHPIEIFFDDCFIKQINIAIWLTCYVLLVRFLNYIKQ